MKGDKEMDKEIEVLTQYMELLMNLSKLHKKTL